MPWGCCRVVLGMMLGVAAGCVGVEEPDDRPDPAVDVRHYDLRLRVDPDPLRVDGRVEIAVRHAGPVRVVRLALADLTVDTVRVDGAVVAAEREGDVLTVPIAADADSSRIEVVYHGRPSRGLYRAEQSGRFVLYTDSWPDRARGWLPAVDHPADPAGLTLTLDLPAGYEPVAGGQMLRRDTLAGLPIRYALLAADSGRAGLLARTPEALAYFDAEIGPYAFPSYTVVQAPIGYGGMENAAAPFLAADLFHGAPEVIETVQVHEAAHQWFGSRVTPADWRDLWLSEGMATYLAARFFAARARWVELARVGAADRRRHGPLVPPGRVDPAAHLNWVTYRKGACVLYLLRLAVGEAAFDAALREVYRAHAGGPLSTEQWREALETASGRDLDPFFAYWVYGDRLPVLRLTWDAGLRRLGWTVEGDDATLAGIPAELEIRQGNRMYYPALAQTAIDLPDTERPRVRPVGVPLRIDWD